MSFGAVSWRCLGGGFGGVLEVDLGSLGSQFEGLSGASVSVFIVFRSCDCLLQTRTKFA